MELPLNQILQGDCVKEMKKLPAKSVDMIFADPPYNLQLQNELTRPNQTLVDAVDDEWDQFESFKKYDKFTSKWLSECRRVLKDTGTIWVIGTYHNIYRVGKIMMDLDYWILNDVIWYKSNGTPNFKGRRLANVTETLIWAQKIQGEKLIFDYQALKNLNDGKQMRNVWSIPVCRGKERIKINGQKAHSTQKPEALLYFVILSSTKPGHTVLDPFFGTGTTGAVAKKLQRNFIGIERESSYVKIAQKRIDSIGETQLDYAILNSLSKRDLPRVDFALLIGEGQYLRVGQELYSQDRKYTATIKADSNLAVNGYAGSIHQVAAHLQNTENFNGWEFWFYENGKGKLESIDMLREAYRRDNKLE